MAVVIAVCRTCGFDIPAGSEGCPSCARPEVVPSRAARQVAGLALPTRSVHALPTTPPRREVAPRAIGRARTARSAFSFTTALAVVTVSVAALAWLAQQPRWVLQLPDGTADALENATRTSAIASVVALGVGLVALAVWCARAVGRSLRGALAHRRHA